MSSVKVLEQNTLGTNNYRIYATHFDKLISYFHDIPTWINRKDNIVNMIVEIPKGYDFKLEINKDIEYNPIIHDVSKGQIRKTNIPYPFNYGAIPQTWENPHKTNSLTGMRGDSDPLDICEIGTTTYNVGDVIDVKILGVLAMIDNDETDWKVIGISTADKNFNNFKSHNDITDLIYQQLIHFFENYKDKEVKFHFNKHVLSREIACQIIDETHNDWKSEYKK